MLRVRLLRNILLISKCLPFFLRKCTDYMVSIHKLSVNLQRFVTVSCISIIYWLSKRKSARRSTRKNAPYIVAYMSPLTIDLGIWFSILIENVAEWGGGQTGRKKGWVCLKRLGFESKLFQLREDLFPFIKPSTDQPTYQPTTQLPIAMSDRGRKSLSDQVSESIKPNFMKTDDEIAKENISGKTFALSANRDLNVFSQTLSTAQPQLPFPLAKNHTLNLPPTKLVRIALVFH